MSLGVIVRMASGKPPDSSASGWLAPYTSWPAARHANASGVSYARTISL